MIRVYGIYVGTEAHCAINTYRNVFGVTLTEAREAIKNTHGILMTGPIFATIQKEYVDSGKDLNLLDWRLLNPHLVSDPMGLIRNHTEDVF